MQRRTRRCGPSTNVSLERERENEGERERERERERETGRQRDRETETDRERERQRQREGGNERYTKEQKETFKTMGTHCEVEQDWSSIGTYWGLRHYMSNQIPGGLCQLSSQTPPVVSNA